MLRRLVARLTQRGSPSDAEIERELRDHLELEAETLAAREGAAPADARFAAKRRFGNMSSARDSVSSTGQRLNAGASNACSLKTLYWMFALVSAAAKVSGVQTSVAVQRRNGRNKATSARAV